MKQRSKRFTVDRLPTTNESSANDVRHQYGRALKRELAERNWPQHKLGELVGVSQAQVSEWVRGTANMTLIQMIAVDTVLGKPPGWLLWSADIIDLDGLRDSIEAEYGTSRRPPRDAREPVSVDPVPTRVIERAVRRTLVHLGMGPDEWYDDYEVGDWDDLGEARAASRPKPGLRLGQVYKRADGKWAFRVLAPNGEILAADSGQGYATRRAARAGIRGIFGGPIEEILPGAEDDRGSPDARAPKHIIVPPPGPGHSDPGDDALEDVLGVFEIYRAANEAADIPDEVIAPVNARALRHATAWVRRRRAEGQPIDDEFLSLEVTPRAQHLARFYARLAQEAPDLPVDVSRRLGTTYGYPDDSSAWPEWQDMPDIVHRIFEETAAPNDLHTKAR